MPLNKDIEDISEIIDPILATFNTTLKADLVGRLTTIYLSGQAEVISYGKTKMGIPILYEGPPPEVAIDWAKKHGASLVTQMDGETKRRLANVISSGIQNKRGVPGIARDIRKDFESMSRYRSQLIAKTETRQALFQASHDNMVDMGIEGKEWVLGAGGAEGNCEYCQANSAVGVIPVSQEFPNPEGDIHPGCLLPDNEILPLGLEASSRTMYEGIAIELKTREGHQLTVTPNHMILTPNGFVKANTLHNGDDVINCLDTQRIASIINPDNDQMPTRIKDIWYSLLVSEGSTSISVPTSPIDFHGDAIGFNGDVDIVFSASFLRSCNNTLLAEKIYKLALSRRLSGTIILSNNSPRLQFLNSRLSTLSGDMGISRNSVAVLDRHPGHTNQTGFAIGSRCDTCFKQSTPNYITVNAEPFTERQFGIPRNIEVNHLNGDLPNASISTLDTSSIEDSIESGFAYTELAGQFISRFSSLISLDKIISIRSFFYSGHVYDLQTLEQLYISQGEMSSRCGLILKNCTCAIAPARLRR